MSACYNCGKENIVLTNGTHYSICTNCGAWRANLNVPFNPSEVYDEEYFSGAEYLNYELGKNVHKKNLLRKLHILEKFISFDKMRILEIGSATGQFLQVAKENGVSALIGMEISDFARGIATSNGFDVYAPTDEKIYELIKNFRPNLIIAWDVWEHLETPSLTFEQLLNLATSDSILALSTVDSGSLTASYKGYKWRQFHPPSHINYPTQKSFKLFCKKNKMNILKHFHFGYYRPLAEYLAALFGKRKWIVKSVFLFKIPIYLNLYDTQLIIARKASLK